MKKDKTPLPLRIVRWLYPRVESVFPALAHRYFIRIFFTPLRYQVPEKEKQLAASATLFSITVSGRRIQCYAWGQGPLVLLVHGWAGRGTQFRKIIEVLSREGFRVVSFDGPAHGKSDGTRTNILEFVEVMREMYRNIGEPEAIIAHSFGGSVALAAAAHGLRVKKLINIASPTIGDEIINTYLRAINGSQGSGDFFRSYIVRQYGKSFDEFTSLHFIHQLTQDIDLLLIHDENDEEVILKHALDLKRAYPEAQLMVTKGLGHTRILHDEAVVKSCVTFVRNGRLNS